MTIYFYNQHKQVVNEYHINKNIKFENATIKFEKLSMKNSDKKDDIKTNWLMKFTMNHSIDSKLFRIGEFFTKPFNRLDYNILIIRAMIKTDDQNIRKKLSNETMTILLYEKEQSLDMYNKIFSYGEKNIQYEARFKWNDSQSLPKKLTIIINDKNINYHEKIILEPTWEKITYNFFHLKDTLKISTLE